MHDRVPDFDQPNQRAPQEQLAFQDLKNHAPVGAVRRALTRYLFTRNAERSIRLHTYLGAPLLRTAIMGTYGRFSPRSSLSNYRTDASKSRIEAATRFAVGGSVFNEVIHASIAMQQGYELTGRVIDHGSVTA